MVNEKDRAYFRRLAEQNRLLGDEPPTSLQEAMERLNDISSTLGVLTENTETNDDGDLQSHLSYLKRLRSLDPSYRATRS